MLLLKERKEEREEEEEENNILQFSFFFYKEATTTTTKPIKAAVGIHATWAVAVAILWYIYKTAIISGASIILYRS